MASRRLSGRIKPFHEPSPRCWHYAVPAGEKLFMWGGRMQNRRRASESRSRSRSRLESVVETYDPYLELWEQHPTSGTPPVGLYDGACASLLDSLYSYGGFDGIFHHGGLHRFDIPSMSWSEVEVRNASEGPMKKHGCRMVACQGDKLLLIGGYGIPTAAHQPAGGSFHRDSLCIDGGDGWTNEMHLFHLQEGVWTSPATTGTRPPACSHFSLTSIDPKRAVFFGGNQPGQGRVNDVYILDLEAMHWTKVDKSGGGPWPVGRSSHAACCINYGQEHPQLLVTGGHDKSGEVFGDAWLLDVDSATWKKLALSAEVPPRAGHTATAFSLAPGLTEVTMFGRYNKWPSRGTGDTLPKVSETNVLQLESTEIPSSGGMPSTQEWDLVGVATKGQLGSAERLREKMVKMHLRTTMVEKREAGKGGRTREGGVQGAQIRELQERVTAAEDRAQRAERRSQELQLQVQATTSRAQEFEARAVEAEKKLRQPFWVVQQDEIQLTNEKLGEGGWGSVHVAKFRGSRVAAKCCHNIIASDYTRDLFIREMTMAAQVRHPNLLQFIGATLKGKLIILTELMPTSLRAELEKGALPHYQIISISLDVAQALNYLHLMRPNSIIHRDLSSANVLMEPKPENTWKAKVSDYGSINLLQKLQTAMPGNPVYAAPESNDPLQQSPKMDIFSFGVLLVEICTATFPDIPDRERLIRSVADHRMRDLIKECLAKDRDNRSSATEIIKRLSKM